MKRGRLCSFFFHVPEGPGKTKGRQKFQEIRSNRANRETEKEREGECSSTCIPGRSTHFQAARVKTKNWFQIVTKVYGSNLNTMLCINRSIFGYLAS